MTSSFVAEVDRFVEEVQSELTPATRFNVSGIEALNLSTRLADVLTNEKRKDVTQRFQRCGWPRPKRTVKLLEALRSPTSSALSCSEWDILFSNSDNVSVMRGAFESMMPGVTVHVNVIGAWSVVLNYEEEKRRIGATLRLFCSAGMLVSYSCI
ncbi:hypothetical protein Hanom_Chr02g00095321 [Helianthus anomalus]